jgi:hypothetical protein
LKPNLPRNKSLAILFEEMFPQVVVESEKVTKDKKRKTESLLSTDINIATRSENDEVYFVTFPYIF